MTKVLLEVEALVVRAAGQAQPVVDDVSFSVAAGELLAVLGPAGSGKTSLLRAIAGLDRVAAGTVRMAGADVARVPVERRPTTLVFEDPVLLPDLTVEGNVAFAVQVRAAEASPADVVEAAITALDLGRVRHRMPAALSAGQRRRVALARALVRRPAVLLLDEPLANVDPAARRALRGEVVRMHARMGCATVYATHDADDALAAADRVVVLRDGRVVQQGAPRDVRARPASTWVAQRLGLPTFVRAVVVERTESDAADDCVVVDALGSRMRVPAAPDVVAVGQRCVLVGGAAAVRLVEPAHDAGAVGAVGRVVSSTFAGDVDELEVETDGGTVLVHVWPADGSRRAGDVVHVAFDPSALWALAH